ncbi:MAG: hypothetical protein IPK50_00515 [Fibrobacterota bacterium]|nr:MAG: hypothetical protein IPK50_00515 [Fibrobacterota bacterium]
MPQPAFTKRLVPIVPAFLLLACPMPPIVTDPVDQIEANFQQALADLNSNSKEWQAVVKNLEGTIGGLQGQVDETLRNDVATLAGRSTAKVYTGAGCTFDRYSGQARQSIQSMLSRYKQLKKNKCLEVSGGKVVVADRPECKVERANVPPLLCAVEPTTVNLSVSDAESWSTVSLHGFGLDALDSRGRKFDVVMVDDQERVWPIPETRIARNLPHYMATFSLVGLGKDLFQRKIGKIKFRWGPDSQMIGEILILPWKPQEVDTHVVLGPSPAYYPPLIGGDRDFYTKSDRPTDYVHKAWLKLSSDSTLLIGQSFMSAIERMETNPKNKTIALGNSPEAIWYAAPKGWKILSFLPNLDAVAQGATTDHLCPSVRNTPAAQVASFKDCIDDGGDDVGRTTRQITEWRPLRIRLRQTAPPWLN